MNPGWLSALSRTPGHSPHHQPTDPEPAAGAAEPDPNDRPGRYGVSGPRMRTVDGALGRLSPEQRGLLERWIPGAMVEKDHSWGIVETTVLEMTRGGARFIQGHRGVRGPGPPDDRRGTHGGVTGARPLSTSSPTDSNRSSSAALLRLG
ncbi:hypothetical protein GCM10010109_80060 [Actinoplanes campanulatus]|nr:hypothetical protein GCM10010109_80060 [Actinoplanes campanulatus]GID41115.1 hypothetical protein Aca09nite_76210 [Actinoplanes campanulatus]